MTNYNSNIIDERIHWTQYAPEFEKLVEEFIKLQPERILEIGSYFGSSLHHWLYYCNKSATVVSVDLPIAKFCGSHDPRVPVQEYLIRHEWKLWTKKQNAELFLVQEPSQLKSTTDKVCDLFANKKLDFVFIDGDHRYEAVKTDFEIYSKLVRTGGIVALHDIGYAEEGGVHKLWDEIKTKYTHMELRLHPKTEKGIGIVYV